MKLKWLGYSAFLVTSGDGTRIMMDPYEVNANGFQYDAID
ncbi:MAG: MBL fold metallo-hydrolase [Chloroflexota bacterium]|nr:MBL fold metallo-hydrolase [Chloroflexota bacterium]